MSTSESTDRDRMLGDLHYACRRLSKEHCEAVLKLAKAFAVDDGSYVGTRLVNQNRVLIAEDGRVSIRVIWFYDDVEFLRSDYYRSAAGEWSSSVKSTQLSSDGLEQLYQAKLKLIDRAAAVA